MTTVEVLTPSSREEWLAMRLLGASDVPVLLVDDHPWQTPYGLWAERRGLAPPRADTQDLRLGRYIESVALKFLQDEKQDWVVTPNVIGEGGKLFVDRATGRSCTPDALITDPTRGPGVCNVKKVSGHIFNKKWRNGGVAEVPVYTAIQVIQEVELTEPAWGCTWGCVAAIVLSEFGSEFHLLEVPLHPGIAARIRTEAADFWRRVGGNDPYPPDYYRDGDLIKSIDVEATGGEIDFSFLEVEPYNALLNLLARREALKLIEGASTDAKKERDAIDCRLLYEFLGNAARGTLTDGRVIEAKTVRRAGYAVKPSSYRSVKIKTPKEKSAAA
ncbi:MAG: hypothetical protein ACREC9_12410 [Methylocella sp.]